MLQLTAIGRLTRDPEFKSNRQGSQFLVFDLAVNKGYGNNQTTVFVSCCASEGVKNALSKAKKGSHVVVTGELSTEIYQKNDGSTGENIKCFVTSFSFISSGGGQRNNQQNGNHTCSQRDCEIPAFLFHFVPFPSSVSGHRSPLQADPSPDFPLMLLPL